ncbi:MFS transporter [Microcoleus sp. FACHB-1515]|uniref:MFS transporter n=1 Tax=Cyanophyceae TaxID=3028117 RepID=UPI0016863FC2|nr:MFS transporter [Microcoleus sp. FACHB-1515]MBD2088862.1 MFS transporter [Microcoleus sp. FACHB-1515]
MPRLDHRVWILFIGRLLSQFGTGFTLFYAPIFFVNQVGLSATAVGAGIGSGSITGIAGRILGGSFADSRRWGRRKTLLLSAAVSAIACFVLAAAANLPVFVIGNLLLGFGVGLYWPATEAVIADITTADQRNEAYALTRLADNLGLGLGVVLGGVLINTTGAYRSLFVIDGISFVIFFGIIFGAIAETLNPNHVAPKLIKGWGIALRDRPLLIYVIVNVLFTTYLAQIQSAMPLYFSNFAPPGGSAIAPQLISVIFSWHVVLTAITQLPIARWLNRFRHVQALTLAAFTFAIGFGFVWLAGAIAWGHLIWAILSLSILAIAAVAYTPIASAFVVSLAPDALRGIYLSVNSLCWAIGYLLGPAIGGWAMDQPDQIADSFWLVTALSVIAIVLPLRYLDRSLDCSDRSR